MRPDLYALLGVERDASADAIRRAYRRRSKTAHPDVGGDADTFARLKFARDVLLDDERRASYDATGEAEPTQPDNRHAQLLQHVAAVLDEVLAELDGANRKFTQSDVLGAMRRKLGEQLDGLVKRRAALDDVKRKLLTLNGRFRTNSGAASQFDGMVAAKIGNTERALRQVDAVEAIFKAALEFLEDYRFEADPPPPSFSGLRNATTSAATTPYQWRRL